MNLITITNLVKGAKHIYRSGGILTLFYRVIGYGWKEFAWFWIRVQTRGKLIERTPCGNKMYLSPHDEGISKELAVYGIHEPLATQLLRQEIKTGMHVIDIGANIGYYALQEAHLVGETGKVIAIEPVPDNVTLLRKNVEANGYRNVHIYPVAIGTKNGTTKIHISHESNLASLIPQDRHSTSVDVPVWTLDSLLEQEERVDYIQMDIEGYEVEVIKGMIGILRKYRPGMFIEIHTPIVGGESIIKFLKELKCLGYKTKYVIDKAFNSPLVWKKDAVETISIDTLMLDKRVARGQAVLTIFVEAT